MEVLVSVLIPVCNTEKYVRECVESVRGQTLREIEILCLDDGSIDGSAAILDELAEKDERIRVIHKENSGYGSTMNLGIRMARGKYVGIVESDDYIEPDMMRTLYRIAETEKCDFVKSNFSFFWKGKPERIFEEAYLISQKELYQKGLSRTEMKLLFRGYVANCTGIYRRTFLTENQIYHNETPGASYQDLGFFFQVIMKAQKGYLSDQSYYRYRQDNQASSVNSREKVYCIYDEYQFIYQKMTENMELFRQYLPFYQLVCLQGCLFHIRRIAPVFRLDFLKKAQSDFQASESREELDVSAFYNDEKRVLLSLMNNPAVFLDELFRQPDRLRIMIKGFTDVVIYGAGSRGHEVYSWLKEEGIASRNVVYAVSDEVSGKRYKDGIQVKSICDLKPYAKKAAVIVAVTKRYQDELMKNLERFGFQNIITLE